MQLRLFILLRIMAKLMYNKCLLYTTRCYAEHGYATECRLSVRLSVCNVQVP